MTIFDSIINTLHTSEKPLDVVDLAILLNEDADDVGAALLELKRAGRVHENHRHRFRLTNEEKVRLRELVIPEPVGDEVSHGGIVNLAAMHQCVPERCDRCRCWTREPDTEFGWCIHNSRMMQPEHGTCGQFQSSEPTDSELDAIEEEESESSTPIGFAGATVELLSDSEADAMVAQWDVECAAKDRPTKGLRIEQVARELVEVESRRQELLDELRRLVSGG